MTHRCRLLAPILLCDLSLTSSRHLDRLFSHSEAPFSTTRNQSRFRLLHSDYPLYFMSFESPRLNLNKRAYQDRYCLFVLSACAVANQSVLYVGFEHWPDQPHALFDLSVLTFEALNENGRNPFALVWLLGLSSFVDTSGSLQAVAVARVSQWPSVPRVAWFPCVWEVGVFSADFRPIGRKAQRRNGNSAAAIGQYMAVSATGT